jgi:hypothetical protein
MALVGCGRPPIYIEEFDARRVLAGVGRRRRVGGGRQEQSTGTNKATAPDRPE